jgi:multidrug efflux pump subunit AcrB
VFGPYSPFPVEFRVMGPDPSKLYEISDKALDITKGVPNVRQPNRDGGNRTPILRFIPDQDRLNLAACTATRRAPHIASGDTPNSHRCRPAISSA